MTWRASILLLSLLLPVADARAEDAEGYQPPAWPTEPGAADLTGRLGILTVVVLAIAGGVIWWARRLPANSLGGEAGAVPMKVLEAVSLGAGCSLHLLQVEEAHYVVGIDRTGLKAIHPLAKPFEQFLEQDEDEAVAALPKPAPAPALLSG